GGASGIDFGPEEIGSPRKMAARQARLDATPSGLTLMDLESPGGTFVNRQRILSGQGRALREGDVIQLGGIQLKVVSTARPSIPAPPPLPGDAKPSPMVNQPGPPAPFRMASGMTCQNWDDFLTASSKSWKALREELASGRLGAFLASQGRGDLLPRAAAPGQNDDDRLDDWLCRIPTTRLATAAMELHPTALRVKALEAGGVTRASLRITNTGYRLLKISLRIDPTGTSWVKIPKVFASGPFKVPEECEVPIEVTIPPNLDAPIVTSLTVDGVAGSRRVEIRLEPARGLSEFPEPGPSASTASPAPSPVSALRRLALPSRILILAMAGLTLRGLIGLGDQIALRIPLGELESPRLGGAALLMAALGAVLGGRFALKHGESPDLAPSAVAGGVGGILLAAVAVAACRSIEPLLGAAGGILVVDCALWAGVGALAAWALGGSATDPVETRS
ncbi:MAG: FHA domain-containing protein, partial [Isosphaeraceae bacterium]